MPDRIRIACVQMTSRADKAANLETAERLVAHAAATGADVVVLPEKWNAIGTTEELHAAAEPLDGGVSGALGTDPRRPVPGGRGRPRSPRRSPGRHAGRPQADLPAPGERARGG